MSSYLFAIPFREGAVSIPKTHGSAGEGRDGYVPLLQSHADRLLFWVRDCHKRRIPPAMTSPLPRSSCQAATSPPSVSQLSKKCGNLDGSLSYRPSRLGTGIDLLFSEPIV
jgi:hypothetical protein